MNIAIATSHLVDLTNEPGLDISPDEFLALLIAITIMRAIPPEMVTLANLLIDPIFPAKGP